LAGERHHQSGAAGNGLLIDPAPVAGTAAGWRNVWALPGSTAVVVAVIYTWQRVLPLILREQGASDFEIGLSFTLFTIASALPQLLGGILADRAGRKPVIVIPTALAGIIYLAIAWSRGWVLIVVLLALISALSAIQMPGFVSLTAESVPARQRGLAFAIFQLFIGLSVAVGPAVGGLLLPVAGPRWLIAATGLSFLVIYVVRQAYLVETRPRRRAEHHAAARPAAFDKKGLLALLALGSAVTCVPVLTVWGPFIPMFAADVAGLTAQQINYAFAIAPLPAVAISVWAGRLVDTWGPQRVVALGMIGHVVALALWVMVRGWWLAVLALLLAYTTYQLAVIAYDTLRASMAGDEARGRVLGALGTATGIVSGLAPTAGAALMQVFGPTAPYWLAGAACVASLALLPLLRGVSGASGPAAADPGAAGAAGAAAAREGDK
jgi:MFS family permease